jgi:hypothetical protein
MLSSLKNNESVDDVEVTIGAKVMSRVDLLERERLRFPSEIVR